MHYKVFRSLSEWNILIRTTCFSHSLCSILFGMNLTLDSETKTPKVAHSVFTAHRVHKSINVYNSFISFNFEVSNYCFKKYFEIWVRWYVLALERIKLEYWNIHYSCISASVICLWLWCVCAMVCVYIWILKKCFKLL